MLPATAFLFYVWELFAAMHATPAKDFSIVFHNVKFIRAVSLPKDGEVILDLLISPITGQFEVLNFESSTKQKLKLLFLFCFSGPRRRHDNGGRKGLQIPGD